jgi:hypothetical protein
LATIFILLGSVIGFVTGLILYFGFDSGLTAALLVWGASGPVSALLVIALSYAPATTRPDQSDDQMAEVA